MLDRKDAEYLRGLTQRTQPHRNAVVQAVLAGNTYRATYNDTGGEAVLIAGQGGGPYKVGQEVLVQCDVSGRSLGKQPMIVGIAQSAANGLIVVARAQSQSRAAETLTDYPPAPVQLQRGGLARTLTFRGHGLAAAPAYGHASVVNDVAAVITGDTMRLQVKALIGCPVGRFTLTIGGQTLADYFEVV